MKTSSHLASLLSAVVAVACNGAATMPPPNTGPDAAAATLDPTGNWTVDYQFDAACNMPAASSTGTFTVTLGTMGYSVEVAGTQSTGVLECAATQCKLSGTWAWAGSNASYEQNMNLTLAADSSVSGEGTEAVLNSDGTQCTFPFTATGSRM
jgi:hypothetical protein